MTGIELFENTSKIENITSTIADSPKKIIFLGNNKRKINEYIEVYRDILESNGVNNIVLESESLKLTDISDTAKNIEEILDREYANGETDFAIDVTGGEELLQVAVGMVYERSRSKAYDVEIVKINSSTGRKYRNFDGTAQSDIIYNSIKVTVAQNMAIYGGKIRENKGYDWGSIEDLRQFVPGVWSACRQHHDIWNIQTAKWGRIISGNKVTGNRIEVPQSSKKKDDAKLISVLKNNNFITEYVNDDDKYILEFADEKVKNCLTKEGQALELKITLLAMEMLDENENPFFNDVKTGVTIYWDDEGEIENNSVNNEVDVVAMRGMASVYISCKNGSYTIDELYKLNTVADRFGDEYSKKIMIVTKDGVEKYEGIKARAEEMDIKFINIAKMTDDDIIKAIRDAVKN